MRREQGTAEPLYFCSQCGCVMRPSNLSPTEIEVFQAMWDGKKTTAIAEELFRSVKTIESHRGEIYLKAGLKPGVDTVASLFRWGLKEGYLQV